VSEYADSRRSSRSQIIEGISRIATPIESTDEENESSDTEDPNNNTNNIRTYIPLPNNNNQMAAQAADIQALTAAVQALTGQFEGPNWLNVQNAVTALNASVTANNNALTNRGFQAAQLPSFHGGN
jgi:hypothetical protein